MQDYYNYDTLQPGTLPIDSESGLPIAPPPTEIDIIKVKKIFNECKHTEVQEADIYGWDSSYTIDAQEAFCDSVKITNDDCIVLNGDIVRVIFDLEVCATVPLDSGGFERRCTTIPGISKTLRIARAGEEGLGVQCHIYPKCLFCFISERDYHGGVVAVTCCVGIMILLKVEGEVQLMIPTYGYPPPPPSCDKFIGECPSEYVPNWPPYPEQNNKNTCK